MNEVFNKKVTLWQGDITALEIGAIVNAANSSLLGGGGGRIFLSSHKYRFLPESKGCKAESIARARSARARDDGCTSRR